MAKIFLNEGTLIEVSETKAEIRNKIKEDVRKEKNKEEDADHFIEVTMIDQKWIETKPHEDKEPPKRSFLDFSPVIHEIEFDNSEGFFKDIEIKTDLYYKRILFIYD